MCEGVRIHDFRRKSGRVICVDIGTNSTRERQRHTHGTSPLSRGFSATQDTARIRTPFIHPTQIWEHLHTSIRFVFDSLDPNSRLDRRSAFGVWVPIAVVFTQERDLAMISNFFVLSPRGDTIIAKNYRNEKGNTGAHERSHTEAFFRKIKFWDDASYLTPGGGTKDTSKDKVNTADSSESRNKKGDAPPVFMMPDGLTYMHVKRNGLIFGCATARNSSPVTVIDVRTNMKIPSFIYIDFSYFVFSPHFLGIPTFIGSCCQPLLESSRIIAGLCQKNRYEKTLSCCMNFWMRC